MKKAFILMMCLTLGQAAWADIVIDDGLATDIGYEVTETVFVRDAADGGRSRINVLDGATFLSAVTLEQHSRLNMSGGKFRDDLSLTGRSQASITGGSVSRAFAIDNAAATLSGNAQVATFFASGNAVVTIEDNTAIESLGTLESAFISIRGGDIQHLDITENSRVDISGGRFGDILHVASTTLSLSGGVFEGPLMLNSDVDVSGGQFNQEISVVWWDATLTFIGSDFTVNGVPVNESAIPNFGLVKSTWHDSACLTGVVTGTLADGTALNQTVYVVDNDGYGRVNFIPEPASLWLMLVGSWLVRGRRTKQSQGY